MFITKRTGTLLSIYQSSDIHYLLFQGVVQLSIALAEEQEDHIQVHSQIDILTVFWARVLFDSLDIYNAYQNILLIDNYFCSW